MDLVAAILLLLGGVAAGTIGGMLGIGGGVVLMPLLRFGVGLEPAQAAGTCVLAVFFTALGGTWRNRGMGRLHLPSLTPVLVAGVVAVIASSLLFHHIPHREKWLDFGIGVLFLMVSIRMLLEGTGRLDRGISGESADMRLPGSIKGKISIGIIAGVLPGLLGIGTGSVLVPAFTMGLGAPIKTAMVASLACFCINALISASFKAAQGCIEFAIAVPLCAGTLLGAILGASLNRHAGYRILTVLFGLSFTCVSVKFMVTALAWE